MAHIVIKGGTVFNPLEGTETQADLYFEGGTLSSAQPGQDALVIDASGAFVAPGFIDLNTHVFAHNMFPHQSVDADRIGVRQGVACVVDAGSSGAVTIDNFPESVHRKQATQVFATINIGSPGLPHLDVGHASRPDLLDLDGVVKALERHRDWIVGVSVFADQSHVGTFGLEAIKVARKAASLVGKPLMLHLGSAPPVIDDVLDLLRPGDILTHTYHGDVGGVLGFKNEVIPQFKEAVKRGVIVDLGHGYSGFSFDVYETAIDQGMPLHCISTDLHQGSLDIVAVSLARTMTKLRALGMSLADVVLRVTANPARAIDIDRFGFGSLTVGESTTATIFREREGEFELVDTTGDVKATDRFIEPIGCVADGQFYTLQEPL